MTSDFKWGTLITCVRRLRDSRECAVPFIDWEVLPPFDGSPDGIFAWFICDSAVTKDRFHAEALADATQRLRSMAADAGFPKESADTVETDVTNEEEIAAGGGRFGFFR